MPLTYDTDGDGWHVRKEDGCVHSEFDEEADARELTDRLNGLGEVESEVRELVVETSAPWFDPVVLAGSGKGGLCLFGGHDDRRVQVAVVHDGSPEAEREAALVRRLLAVAPRLLSQVLQPFVEFGQAIADGDTEIDASDAVDWLCRHVEGSTRLLQETLGKPVTGLFETQPETASEPA